MKCFPSRQCKCKSLFSPKKKKKMECCLLEFWTGLGKFSKWKNWYSFFFRKTVWDFMEALFSQKSEKKTNNNKKTFDWHLQQSEWCFNPSFAEHNMPVLANSVDPDQFALFVIKYVNFYQKPRSSNLTGWKLEVGMASLIYSARQSFGWFVVPFKTVSEALLMSTHNIYFCGHISPFFFIWSYGIFSHAVSQIRKTKKFDCKLENVVSSLLEIISIDNHKIWL